MISVIYQLNWY